MPVSKKAFEDQVLALLGSMRGMARRLTGNEAEADDIVAEAVARAWRSRESLEDEAAFRAWIFRILHHTFISERRRPGCKLEVRLEHAEDDGEDDDAQFSIFEQTHQPFLLWFSNPEQEFLDKLLRQDLERALAALPEHHRVVVVLADLEEFKYEEIAQALDIPIGTVRSRLARARSALQKSLWQTARDWGISGAQGSEPFNETKRTAL